MKKHLTLLLLCLSVSLFAQVNYNANTVNDPYTGLFRPGINPSFYPNWTSEQVADVAAGNSLFGQPGLGVKSFRTAMSDDFVTQFGYDYLLPTYDYYGDLGLEDLTVIVGFPHPDNQETTEYCSGIQSEMFDGLYEPIWDGGANGTPYDDNNKFAAYMYEIVTRYTPYIKFWEIWNEPGFDYSGNCGWREPGDPVCNWWDQDPDPCDYKLRAPIERYVRTLRIAYDIIKTVSPDDKVVVAGVGFESFLDAILRNTDNPNGGSVTADYPNKGGAYFDIMGFHSYPHFDGTTIYYDNNIGGLAYERHSDRAAFGIPFKQMIRQDVLDNYGYDGVTSPKKGWIVTEINIPRDPVGGQWIGSEEAQKNYIIKAMVNAMKGDVAQLHVFRLGEREYFGTANNGQTGNPEFNLMGLYQRMDDIQPYEQVINIEGIAYKTGSDCLYGSTFDQAKTNQMNIPSNLDGGAFLKPNGDYIYVVWAKTTVDLSETANGTYSFPASFGFNNLYKKEWDFSQTANSTLISSNNIPLTATPIFLTEDEPTAPAFITLLCPADVTVFADATGNGAIASWTAPNVSTTCASGLSISQVGGPTNGSYFNLGATEIEYEATDDCGITTLCSFNVIVQAIPGGCPDAINGYTFLGEYDDHKYFISNAISRPADAQISAQTVGGHLVSINSAGENDFIKNNISELVYIGLNDATTEGVMEWANGDPVTYENYDPCSWCSPNTDDDDYVVMHSWNGGWSYSNQFNQRLSVIELPCSTGTGGTFTLNCPADLTFEIPAGAPNGITPVTWDTPTVTSSGCVSNSLTQTNGPDFGQSVGPGVYTVTYFADYVCGGVPGNTTCSFTITVVDNNTGSNLSLNCPPDFTIQVPQGSSTATLNWNTPTASTDCNTGSITIGQNAGPSLGASVSPGTYTIGYFANDGCSSNAQCNFIVTVVDNNVGSDCPNDIAGFTAIGEYGGHKYYLSNDVARPVDAHAAAVANNGYLVTINSQGENDFIQQGINEMVYIGLNDQDSEGNLEWFNGEPVTYNNVDPCGFCEENSANQDFAIMAPWNGSWSFSNFWNQRKYVMEVNCDPILGNPIELTCGGDLSFETPVGTSVAVTFLDPQPTTGCPGGAVTLTQTGGPTSGAALSAGTYTVDYFATDDCGNNASCSFTITISETGVGGCPTSLPNFTKLGEFGGHAYFLSDDIARAEDGEAAAQSVGGHLVTINSAAENNFLNTVINDGVVYIGANDAVTEDSPAWFDGTAFSYENFDICPGCQGNEDNMDYVIFHSWNGGWSWSNFWSQRQYVIEVDCTVPFNGSSNNSLNTLPTQSKEKLAVIDRVMPNPADDYLFVKMIGEKEETIDLQIFDARGVLLQTTRVDLTEGLNFKELNISDLPTGLYYVMIPQGQKNSRVMKFVKQRM